MIEFYSDIDYFSSAAVWAIASMSRIVVQDVSLVGEFTPPIVAAAIAALSPRPVSQKIGAASILICLFGYSVYLVLGISLVGNSLPFSDDRDLRSWFTPALHQQVFPLSNGESDAVPLNDLFDSLERFFESIRLLYLITGAAVLGFMVNDARSKKSNE
ncbi:hypothetical protein QTA57_08635 [Fontisubflavum oceani]|uniref:hypothetical protein n=1 Tax=Fontisubflavum oceani TaxID=2978973 RepID=UPI0025B392F6|nr:hypothetical protein [Fontisubflavum oceani]WJY23119.1 hypothetical protein QTA57_08635 [Fontisubflavum oceani]